MNALLMRPNASSRPSIGIAIIVQRMQAAIENKLKTSSYNSAVQDRAFQLMVSKWTRSEALPTIGTHIAGYDQAVRDAQTQMGLAVHKRHAFKGEAYLRFEAIRYRFKRLLMRLDTPTKDEVFKTL